MFWNKKPIEPPKEEKLRYSTTELQVGDSCICLYDNPHSETHQKLLVKGEMYIVRHMEIGDNGKNFGGPFIRIAGIKCINDAPWSCTRFQKIPKQSKIIERLIEEPICIDLKKEFADAKKMWKAK